MSLSQAYLTWRLPVMAVDNDCYRAVVNKRYLHAVSYTHLDVYKRQQIAIVKIGDFLQEAQMFQRRLALLKEEDKH